MLFPGVSIIAKAGCRDVEHSVSAIRDAQELHWVRPFGIVDNDRREQEDIDGLRKKGTYALPVFSVESIYYHPSVQELVAKLLADVTGASASDRIAQAKTAALKSVKPHAKRLSERVSEKAIRKLVFSRLPGKAEVSSGLPIDIHIDIAAIVSDEQTSLLAAIEAEKLGDIIARYPVRDTPALNKIAEVIGFQDRGQYEKAVLKLLADDYSALQQVRSLFGTLSADLDCTDAAVSASIS